VPHIIIQWPIRGLLIQLPMLLLLLLFSWLPVSMPLLRVLPMAVCRPKLPRRALRFRRTPLRCPVLTQRRHTARRSGVHSALCWI
jgi:hypothetical protein